MLGFKEYNDMDKRKGIIKSDIIETEKKHTKERLDSAQTWLLKQKP